MGLDVYVGSLTRYYLESPVAVVEQMARQQRVPYAVVRDHGDPMGASWLEPVTRAAVLAWRDGLGRQLGDRLDGPLDWDESPSGPWFTDKPGWDGYGGAVLLAAHAEHPALPLPEHVSPDWPDDPAYLASMTPGPGSRFDQVLIPELWLPCPFAFTFRTLDVTGQEVEVGSSPTLLGQLAALRAEDAGDHGPLAPVARAGLAVLLRMAERSVRHRLPMKLDF
ncbi:MAG TPA: hypothetical protein VFA46_07970 [Actinomycetes bacterium]|jgi:hypothetical protein|nr:hypothetical protein [Actinomycetes bacterium]